MNPDVAAGGHPHIATGSHTHKFGLDWPEARRLYLAHKDSKYLQWKGISAHIGSQIVSLTPFRRAFRRIAGYVKELRRAGIDLKYLDLGGGLGVRYTNEKTSSRVAYAQMVASLVRPLGLHLLLEPGRSIIAAAGILLTKVIYTKRNRGKTFVVVDAAMNDLLRPALYGAIHPITRIVRESGGKKETAERVDIVGPVCETGDCLLHDWPLGDVKPGDLASHLGGWSLWYGTDFQLQCANPAERGFGRWNALQAHSAARNAGRSAADGCAFTDATLTPLIIVLSGRQMTFEFFTDYYVKGEQPAERILAVTKSSVYENLCAMLIG